MSGFLGNSDDYKMMKEAYGRHIIYSNGKYVIAVPFMDANDGILLLNGWQWTKLCPS
jgi:hypothetical protein